MFSWIAEPLVYWTEIFKPEMYFLQMSNNEVHQSLPVGPDLPAVQQQELRDTGTFVTKVTHLFLS